ncbi:hypothetical protein LZ24_00765 [Desulfobotulus alkaliphilus]|uniref:DDE superfamily endonuclease n=1 Tax=Desulfobotulus alkaliphilus TaxID=622671 RepID=A0A562S3G9_9BACT|nr:hypothetical protein [Desulfobotulus alkaliphilus]TWI75314.1 hypothetical protein LZ24_00765 [Desulfobotulus alkaliphilus]
MNQWIAKYRKYGLEAFNTKPILGLPVNFQAEKEKVKIFFADESAIRSDYHSGTTRGPTGVIPIVEKTGARFGINMISTIGTSGQLRFMTIDGKMDSDKIVFRQRGKKWVSKRC